MSSINSGSPVDPYAISTQGAMALASASPFETRTFHSLDPNRNVLFAASFTVLRNAPARASPPVDSMNRGDGKAGTKLQALTAAIEDRACRLAVIVMLAWGTLAAILLVPVVLMIVPMATAISFAMDIAVEACCAACDAAKKLATKLRAMMATTPAADPSARAAGARRAIEASS